MHQNSPQSSRISKIFLGGDAPTPPYKGRLRGYRLRGYRLRGYRLRRCALRTQYMNPPFSNPRSATERGPRPGLVATSHRLASCVIVSRFRTALDLDTYLLSNIRPQCAERAKRSRGKPVLIMQIGFLACFHAISLERSRFSKIASLIFVPL